MRRVTARDDVAIELLVLDAQGVVFNNPWSSFLDDVAFATGRPSGDVRRLWREDLHDDAWLGELPDDELWSRLTGPQATRRDWARDLEMRYRLGAVARHLDAWRQRAPIWVLSNHRTEWLLARLSRFGIIDRFDRVLVSDTQGVMKPDPTAFDEVLAEVSTADAAMFVDDQPRNVKAARQLGMTSVLADVTARWIDTVDRALPGPRIPIAPGPLP